MKSIVCKYHISKFRNLVKGLFYAIITMITLFLCLICIYGKVNTNYPIYMLFFSSLFSYLMGFCSIFMKNRKILKSRIDS